MSTRGARGPGPAWASRHFETAFPELVSPFEESDEFRRELKRWCAFYQVTSPELTTLVRFAYWDHFRLLKLRELVDQYGQMIIGWAEQEWYDAQEKLVEEATRMLAQAPGDAIGRLGGHAAGCRWQINRWQRLKGLLEKSGTWSEPDRDEAIRLIGVSPVPEDMRRSEEACVIWLSCLITSPDPRDAERVAQAARDMYPQQHEDTARPEGPPSPEECRDCLGMVVARRLKGLREREEELWVTVEQPARAQAVARELESHHSFPHYTKHLGRLERRRNSALAELTRQLRQAGRKPPRGVPYDDG